MVSALIRCQHCFRGGIATLRQNKSKFSARMLYGRYSGLWLSFHLKKKKSASRESDVSVPRPANHTGPRDFEGRYESTFACICLFYSVPFLDAYV